MTLSTLKFTNHPIFDDVEISLGPDNTKYNHKTVFIGPNGTGKSYLLASICDIIIAEISTSKEKIIKKLDFDYELKLNKKTISNQGESKKINISRILAITNTYNDRFYFPTKNGLKNIAQYRYLGLKSASNNIFFSNIKDDLFKSLVTIINNRKKCASAIKILNELKFNQKIAIIIDQGKNFKKIINKSSVSSLSDQSLNRFLESEYYINNTMEVSNLLNNVLDEKFLYFELSLSTMQKKSNLYFFNALIQLTTAKILSVTKLSIFSQNGYDINEVSSGEFNILRVLLSLIANVENNSVILIDEPEISLHPNWQIEFCPYLDLALSEFKNCHTIISTHSHFIISNLQPDTSNVITLNPSSLSKNIYMGNIEYNTYGLSPENILYQLFGVTGFNNKYFENDIRLIIDYISNPNDNKDHFEKAYERLSRYKFDTTSPINNILAKAEEFL